jgi:hypothetical protein
MLHEYHVIYNIHYYPWSQVTVVGLGMYHLWIQGHYCIRKWEEHPIYIPHQDHAGYNNMYSENRTYRLENSLLIY